MSAEDLDALASSTGTEFASFVDVSLASVEQVKEANSSSALAKSARSETEGVGNMGFAQATMVGYIGGRASRRVGV